MLILLLVLIVIFGGFGASPYNEYGIRGWSPLFVLLLIILVLQLAGYHRFF